MTTKTDRATLPSFLVIGAMRSGTTTLAKHLSGHPQVFMAEPKELHYFLAERNLPLGERWYRAHFEAGSGLAQRGEASVTYTQYPRFEGVAERIAGLVPDARLVYLVRDPVERMRSHYEHEVAALVEHRPIGTALLDRPKYLGTSRYAMQLDRYRALFAREQLLVVTTEALSARPGAVLREVYTFLGVDPEHAAEREYRYGQTARKQAPVGAVSALRGLPGFAAVAKRLPPSVKSAVRRHVPQRAMPPERPSISPALRVELVARLRDDVARLRDVYGVDVDDWGIR